MLFSRRNPLNLLQKLRIAAWPKNGWRRSGRYVWHRLSRLKDSPHGIAAGVASGVAISFTPFIGFHLIGAVGIALATRGNLIAAWVGTTIGNPSTFPFIWLFIYQLGTWILGTVPDADIEGLSLDRLMNAPTESLRDLLLPMTVGGLPVAALSWFISYWPVKRAIEGFQARRARKLEKAQQDQRARLERQGRSEQT